jgi:hypothetical protein
MTNKLRALLRATIISFGGLVAILASTTAFASTTLQVVRGSGEFQTLETAITITTPEALTMQWTTDQSGATGGTWLVTNASAGNKVVASGETPTPTAGHFLRFTIPANAFLLAASPTSSVKFNITIVPHNAAKQPLGGTSQAVVVTEVADSPQKPVVFGPSAVFPTVEIVTYNEKIGVAPLTQLHFAGADVTLRVSNKGTAPTDPMWLSLSDNSLLMRQNSPKVSLSSLKAGATQIVSVHLDAILPPPTSPMPNEAQYATWSQQYKDRCGVDLRTVMDWRGPQAKTPLNDHAETIPSFEGLGGYPNVGPNTPICDSAQCVKVCQISKNIHAELDGHAVGYTFFVGQYPKFNAFGQSRTSADGLARDFTPTTKVTVASVSKIVTAIGAIRILDKNHVDLDASIGKYLPSDWVVSDYVKNITFAQLLSQRSGIMDYGNVANDYETLKNFYAQGVSSSTTTICDPRNPDKSFMTVALGKGINPNNPNPDKSQPLPFCYSNFNFSILRILLPKVAGLPEDPNLSTRPQTLADQYVKLIQQNEFDLVGQKDVTCKAPSQNPAASTYAFGYTYPGTKTGHNWPDNSLGCGAAGWYLSVEDISKVLLSISSKDGKIFSTSPANDQFDIMRQRGLGLDVTGNTEMEKNGAWGNCDDNGKNCGSVTTSVAIFGPVTGPRVVGVLFINSDISGGPSSGGGARGVLEKAYNNALTPKP